MRVPNHHVWLHSQDDCQPTVVHEVAVSASGNDVCVGVTAVEQSDFICLFTFHHNTFVYLHVSAMVRSRNHI